MATLGTDISRVPFAWDNERPAHRVPVDGFAIDEHDVTNADFLQFVEADGYRDPRWWSDENWEWARELSARHPFFWELDGGQWHWRGMFERVLLPIPARGT